MTLSVVRDKYDNNPLDLTQTGFVNDLKGFTWCVVKKTMSFAITAPLFIASNTVGLLSLSYTPRIYQYFECHRYKAIYKLDVMFSAVANMITSKQQSEVDAIQNQGFTPEPYLPSASEVLQPIERLQLIAMQVSIVFRTFNRLMDGVDKSLKEGLRKYVEQHQTHVHNKTCIFLISEYFESVKQNDVGYHVSKEHEVSQLLTMYNVHVASYSSLEDIPAVIDDAKKKWKGSQVDLVCLVGEGSPGCMQINSDPKKASCLLTKKSFNNMVSNPDTNITACDVNEIKNQLKADKTVVLFDDHRDIFNKMSPNGKIILNWCCADNKDDSFLSEMKRCFPNKNIYGHRDIISEMLVTKRNGDLSVIFSSHYGRGYNVQSDWK